MKVCELIKILTDIESECPEASVLILGNLEFYSNLESSGVSKIRTLKGMQKHETKNYDS